MKVFYYCYGSAHSSVVAAAIHLGYLPTDRVPSDIEFINLPYYDKTKSSEIGTPFFMGYDNCRNEIFIIGMGRERNLVRKTIISFLKHNKKDIGDILMVNTLRNVNIKTKIGGFLSRGLGLVPLGRPLTIRGIQEKYLDFVDMVDGVKVKLRDLATSNSL